MQGWKGLLCIGLLMISTIVFSRPCAAQEFEGTDLSRSSQPYNSPPYKYENSRFIYVSFRTSPEVLAELVPAPLVPNSGGQIGLYISLMNVTAPVPFSYHEAALQIPVSYGEKQGNYMAILYLDEALPIVAGREIYGFPKVDASISLEDEGGVIRGRVERFGATLIDVTMTMGPPVEPVPFIPAVPMFAVKLVPSVAKGAPPEVKQLVFVEFEDAKHTMLRPGEATLELGSCPTDPLGSIPVLEVMMSVYLEGGFTLGNGEILYDYLSKQ
jgi:acetoacetate decarboxylase